MAATHQFDWPNDAAETRRQVFEIVQEVAGLRADFRNIAAAFNRLEGTIAANQLVNQNAHKAHDDRINELHAKIGAVDAKIGAVDAAEAVKRRHGAALIALFAGALGAAAEFFVHWLTVFLGGKP